MQLNKAEQYFIENLYVLGKYGTLDENPRPKWKDGTPAHSLFVNGIHEVYDLVKGELPITELRPIAFEKAIGEICWIYQDQTSDISLLEKKYDIKWWRDWLVDENTIGQRYGNTVARYDLMNKLLKGLKENPFSRRHIMSLWQESEFEESDGLYPCAFLTMWSVSRRDESDDLYLDLTLIQRSSDYVVAGHINKMQYVALQMMVATHCGYQVGVFNHFTQSMHVYDRHLPNCQAILERVDTLLEREIQSQPQLILNVPNGTNFYNIKPDDFILIDYDPINPQLKFPLAI